VKLLVTGGAGYLGTAVSHQAAEVHETVIATWLNRQPEHGQPLRVDLADASAVDVTFRDAAPEVVIHTAYRQGEEHLTRDVVAAAANVAHASQAIGARLVHMSTDLVFDGDGGAPYVEHDAPRPVSAYGRAKLEAERSVAATDPSALIVRTSLLYGNPGGPQEELALRDDVAFFTDEIRTPIHVADLAAALLELAVGDLAGILHVAGPDALSRYDFARRLAEAQGRDPDELRPARTPPGRARDVALSSARAVGLLRMPIHSVYER
jgi:dTDP-4-dehydrorhamnose reductase